MFGAFLINLSTGAPLKPDWTPPALTGVLVQSVFALAWIGLGEEPAWRGYALPRLLVGRSALAAALLLGLLHALWHLPLFGVEYDLANGVPWAITVLCVAVVTTWIWLHTGGSLLLPMLLHASNNAVTFVWRGLRRAGPGAAAVDLGRAVADRDGGDRAVNGRRWSGAQPWPPLLRAVPSRAGTPARPAPVGCRRPPGAGRAW